MEILREETRRQDVEQNHTEAQEETGDLRPRDTSANDKPNRYWQLALATCAAILLFGGVTFASGTLTPNNPEDTNASTTYGAGNNHPSSERLLKKTKTYTPRTVPEGEPTRRPTHKPTPSPPTLSPTMAPTIPQAGCRRDRFDNEENIEENNKLYAGSYVCSDDVDQRYWFGIHPQTGNLIWRDTFTGQVKTYYWNKWHQHYTKEQKQRASNRKLLAHSQFLRKEDRIKDLVQAKAPPSKLIRTPEEYEAFFGKGETGKECFEWVKVPSANGVKFKLEVQYVASEVDCKESYTLGDVMDITAIDNPFENIVVEAAEEVVEATEAPSSSSPTMAPTIVATSKEDLIVDYYFTLSIEATFRMHRIYRTEDWNIIDDVVHWELPSTYNITDVHVNCLFTHDCPYMHLHQDGVMVLAWLDYENSKWKDGWMEKNIKRCYDFDTHDIL